MKPITFRLLLILIICVGLATLSVRWHYGNWPWGEQIQLGYSSQSFTDSTGERHPYVLFLPYNHTRQTKQPVLLFLNGIGENGSDGVTQLSNNLGSPIWELRGRFPFICIAPQMTEESRWTDPRSPTALAAIEMTKDVIERYGGDPERIYLTGPSSGGAGTYALAERNPKFFAAIVPLSTGGSYRVDPGFLDLSIWSFHNSGDQEGLVASAREFQKNLIKAGASPLVTEYQQPGHDSWNNAYRDPALFRWLVRQRRDDSQERVKYRLVDLEQLAGNSLTTGVRADNEQRILVNEGWTTSDLFEIPVSTDQLHFEYLSNGRVACEVVVLTPSEKSTDPWQELLTVRIPWPEGGTASIKSPQGNAIGSALAQRSLRANSWNDIRVELIASHCRVQLNGWELMDLSLSADQSPTLIRFALRLAPVKDSNEQQYRYLRTAIPNVKLTTVESGTE